MSTANPSITSIGAVDRIAVDLGNLIQALTVNNVEIPDFSGSAIEDSLKWLNLYERRTDAWTDQFRIQRLSYYFTGTAQAWLKDLKKQEAWNTITFQVFKNLFIKKFVSRDMEELARTKIKEMTFNIDEHRVATFTIDFKQWYEKLYPNYTVKAFLRELLDRFPMQFQRKLIRYNSLDSFESIDDFVAAAEQVEKCVRMKASESAALMASQASSNNVMAELLKEIKEMKCELLALKSERTENKSARRCFKCSGPWPSCGCTSVCKMCSGTYPACGCRRNRANRNSVITPGNGSGPQA